ncbi:glutamate receptor ionotropic, delta-2 [Caerostris darwini]|uniref:Glutamate receptor ionotropic, delta-2 n=1 Tax=Caerostris darwini TaxID=1538125 RepID=A0AAV4V121_9ARAC|nr:glutamate receptor ionotropic, delta-2 [Caerostris darwini]
MDNQNKTFLNCSKNLGSNNISKFPKILKVAILPLRHLLEVSYDKGGKVTFTGGVEANFIKVLSKLLGFQYQIMIPEDGEWGQLKEDGNWTGIIGLVHSNKADIAIGHLTITPSRVSGVDFLPYTVEENSFATKLPHHKPRASFYLLPFQIDVWISIICIILIMPFLFNFLMTSKVPFQKLYLAMFGNIVGQQCSIVSKKCKDRILLGSWFVFALITSCCYRAVLLSCVTVPFQNDDVRNIKELASAIIAGRYKASFSKGSVDRELLTKSLDESLQIIGEHITEEDWLTGDSGNKIVVAPNTFDDFTAVLGPRFFFLLEYGEEPYATKRIFKETISFWNVGLAVRKKFCCKEELIKYIARILNNGILEKLYGDELFKTKLKFNWKEFEKSKNDALTIRHLFGAFILLGAGFCIAILAFLFEVASKCLFVF